MLRNPGQLGRVPCGSWTAGTVRRALVSPARRTGPVRVCGVRPTVISPSQPLLCPRAPPAGCDVGENAQLAPGGWAAPADSVVGGLRGRGALGLLSGLCVPDVWERGSRSSGLGCSPVLTIARRLQSERQRLQTLAASSALGLTVLAFQEDFITLERARELHVTN